MPLISLSISMDFKFIDMFVVGYLLEENRGHKFGEICLILNVLLISKSSFLSNQLSEYMINIICIVKYLIDC